MKTTDTRYSAYCERCKKVTVHMKRVVETEDSDFFTVRWFNPKQRVIEGCTNNCVFYDGHMENQMDVP